MRLVRFLRGGSVGAGIWEDGRIFPVDDLFAPAKKGEGFDAKEAALLTPCVPSKFVCAGLNYRDHAAEMNMTIPDEPVIFIKPATAALAPGGVIAYPPSTRQLEHEAELAVVIGKTARNISHGDAPDYILGFTCINDVTARDLQRRDGQWTRAKSFDTFAPFGPWIETEIDPDHLLVEAYLNGTRRQSSSTTNMKFSPYVLLEFISHVMTLNPGDVIATGTPPGIGPMDVGDEIEVRISGIGSLKNTVGR